MEAEKISPNIFLIVSEDKFQIFFYISRNMYFNSFLKYFLEKRYVLNFKQIFL